MAQHVEEPVLHAARGLRFRLGAAQFLLGLAAPHHEAHVVEKLRPIDRLGEEEEAPSA